MEYSEIGQIERELKEARKRVEFGAALERLHGNRDFRKVVSEGYFRDEAVRLVHLKADPSMQDADSQRSITQQIDAIGAFSAYLHTAQQIASIAAKAVREGERELAEVAAEVESN